MGTCYYFGRVDNHTLFNMDKAYRVGCQLTTGDVVDGTLPAITKALRRIEEKIGRDDAKSLREALLAWSDGREMVFLSEHEVEDDKWRDDDGNLRITGDLFASMRENQKAVQ